jgi:hypothetical protein
MSFDKRRRPRHCRQTARHAAGEGDDRSETSPNSRYSRSRCKEQVLVLTAAQLKAIARARLADAEALLKAGRSDGSAYLCGYAVELALKARTCRTLKWSGFPEKRSEFEGLQSFKTHDLDILLRLSGREQYIKVNLFPEWTAVSQWNPEARYQAVGMVTAATAQNMIAAATKILAKL